MTSLEILQFYFVMFGYGLITGLVVSLLTVWLFWLWPNK